MSVQADIQCKNPKLVLIMSNQKEKVPLEDIIRDQCDSSATICYVYSKCGVIGSIDGFESKFDQTFSQKCPGISWLCLPQEVHAELLTPDSEITMNTKLVITLNVSC